VATFAFQRMRRWRGLAFLLAVSEWVLPYARRSIPSIRCSRCRGRAGARSGGVESWAAWATGETPLKDKRVRVENWRRRRHHSVTPRPIDAVLVDVDKAPAALTDSNNAGFYDSRGIAAAHASLRKQEFWLSGQQRGSKFKQRLRDADSTCKAAPRAA